jgi:hypothetical protein
VAADNRVVGASRVAHKFGERTVRRVAHSRLGPWLQQAELSLASRVDLPGYRLPDFLGIGSAQSGTKWLATNLRLQCEVFLSSTKELRYWGSTNSRMPLRWYARQFREAGSRIAGEITPSYCFLPAADIARVANLLPNAQVIFILRNPIDREFSAARRFFERRQRRAPDTVSESEWLDYLRGTGRPNPYSDHAANLERWRTGIGPEHVLPIIFDDLSEQPESVLVRVAQHLGLSAVDTSQASLPVNANGAADMPDAVRAYLAQLYEPTLDDLAFEYPHEVARWRASRSAPSI